MCTVLLPPGGNPIAVKYIISYHIVSYHIIYHIVSYHILSYHIISYHINFSDTYTPTMKETELLLVSLFSYFN